MNRNPNFSDFDDRLIAHNIVYIIYRLGVSCGDYSFRWHKCGPYSQELQNVIMSDEDEWQPVVLSDVGKKAIDILIDLITIQHDGYTDADWIWTLSSLLFLDNGRDAPDIIISRMEDMGEKRYLNNNRLNRTALDALRAQVNFY